VPEEVFYLFPEHPSIKDNTGDVHFALSDAAQLSLLEA
jgi:hypothetical protein